MKILQWLKKKLTPESDVYYVLDPPCQLTSDLSAELRKLKAHADRLKSDDGKRRLLNTMDRTQDILEELESRIHADAANPARSIRE